MAFVEHQDQLSEDEQRAVRRHLESMVAAEEFAGSARRRRLLEYLVTESLSGRAGSPKAYTIGTKVLDRPSRFNPQVDPIVRVEVGRLRSTMDRYYRAHPEAPVILTIPKGQYGVDFEVVAAGPSPSGGEYPPRLALLPFTDRGSDAEDDFYAEGISRELAIRLNHSSGMSLLADLPVEVFGSDSLTLSGAAQRTGARFVLRGSVRAKSGRLEVSAELYDAVSTSSIWSERLEIGLADLHPFEVEDWLVRRITGRIADAYGVINTAVYDEFGLTHDDEDKTSYRALLRTHHGFRSPDSAAMGEAFEALGKALETHPDHARVLASLSDIVFTSWWLSLDDSLGGIDRAEELAWRAVAADAKSPDAQLALSYVHFARDRTSQFRLVAAHALELDRRSPRSLASVGVLHSFSGDFAEGAALCAEAVDLNPYLPQWWHVSPCLQALAAEDFDQALFEATKIGGAGAFVGYALRIALMGLLEAGDPSAEIRQLCALHPDFAERCDEYVARAIRHPATAEVVTKGIRLSGALAPV